MKTDARETFLADVITTAVEGGVNYWADDTGYEWGTERGKFEIYGDRKYARVTLTDLDDGKAYRITTDKIASAVGKVVRGEISLRADLVSAIALGNAENDAGYIDADGADVLVQIAALGRVVYG